MIEESKVIDAGQVALVQGTTIQKKEGFYRTMAEKNFSKGKFMFSTNQFLLLPMQISQIRMKINGEEYICNKDHTINYQNYRYFPLSLSFMNHSCNPNTIFMQNKQKRNHMGVATSEWYATRDIQKGQQLTCDYHYFCYDEGEIGFQCLCGSDNCSGQIKGFKYLSLSQKLKMLPVLCTELRELWLKQQDKLVIIQDLQFLHDVSLTKDSFELIADRNFEVDQVVFEYKPLQVKEDPIVIVRKGKEYQQVSKDILISAISQDGLQYCKFFTKKSNQPNIKVISKGQAKVGICIQGIKKGQPIIEKLQEQNAKGLAITKMVDEVEKEHLNQVQQNKVRDQQ